jgi:Tfp pilus assembly protein PilX
MDTRRLGACIRRGAEPSVIVRRGFVLAAALLLVVLIGVLLAGVFFATLEESRIADGAALRDRALFAAESAIAGAISGWVDRSAQPIGVGGQELSTISDGATLVALTITRLDSVLYSLVAQARSTSSDRAAMRRIGVVISVGKSVDGSLHIDPISERWWSELF